MRKIQFFKVSCGDLDAGWEPDSSGSELGHREAAVG
jgi:hypothetical protein